MNKILYLIIFIKFISVFAYRPPQHLDDEFYRKCVNAIYRECTHQSKFTEQEIENARTYIQNRFYNIPNPAYKPVRPPCKKLNVRKEFKCLSHKEKLELIGALKEVYRNGVMTSLALYPHATYWPETHKFIDSILFHRILINEMDKALKRINPRVNMPYYVAHDEYNQPELGILWDYIGRAGNHESNYCVTDGPFVNAKPCVKRKWLNDTYIRRWSTVEHYEAMLQNMDAMSGLGSWSASTHFKVHNNCGGSEGQNSVPVAPYDFSFYAYHQWNQMFTFKWQLQDDKYLIPESYNLGIVYDLDTNRIRPANLTRDLIIFTNISVIEAFQIGFGDLCYVDDVVIEAITEITSNKRKEMPFNYQNMPKDLLKKYYPKFYSGNYSGLDYLSSPLMNCNRQCKPISKEEDYSDNIEGQRFLERQKWSALLNNVEFFLDNENVPKRVIDDFNNGGYCSPYIIS